MIALPDWLTPKPPVTEQVARQDEARAAYQRACEEYETAGAVLSLKFQAVQDALREYEAVR